MTQVLSNSDSSGLKIIEEPVLSLMGHTGSVTTLALSQTLPLLYSGSSDSTIRVWPLPPPFERETLAPFSRWTSGKLIGRTRAPISGLALVRWETLLVSCDERGTVSVWDLLATKGSIRLLRSWAYQSGDSKFPVRFGCTCLEAIKTRITLVAVGYRNSKIKVFDVETGEEVLLLQSDLSMNCSLYRFLFINVMLRLSRLHTSEQYGLPPQCTSTCCSL